jgi:hypothetical protein
VLWIEGTHFDEVNGSTLPYRNNLALCYAEAVVGGNPELGAAMKQSAYYRRMRATFLDSTNRPSRTAYEGTGCDLDSSRWGGRSAESCEKQ